jgi:hypothetical protein
MTENANANIPDQLPPLPRAPFATMLATLVVLLVFGGLVGWVLTKADNLREKHTTATGEQQLQELRAGESEILDHYGWDPATKTWRIPIEKAMTVLVEQGKAKGEMQAFPVAPKQAAKEK